MTKIGDLAKDFKSTATKNISELPEFLLNWEVIDDTFEVVDKQTGKTKTVLQKVVNVNGVDYRIPASVFQQIKVLLEDNPKLIKCKVKKSGSLMETRYQVIPLFN